MGQISDTRTIIKNALVGVNDTNSTNSNIRIASNRAILGYETRIGSLTGVERDVLAFAASNSNSSGALAYVGPLRTLSLDELGYGPAIVDVAVFFFKDKGKNQDWTDVDNFTEALILAIRSANYAANSALVPYRTSMESMYWATEDTQGIVVQAYSVEFPDP